MSQIAGIARRWPALLVASVIVLLPVGRAAELPVLLGAIAGIVLIARAAPLRSTAGARLVLALFACYWIPALLSAPAAIEPAKTWATVAAMLRFLPFALFVAWVMRERGPVVPVTTAVGAVVALWAIDACVQIGFGHGLGGAAEAERVSGIFGADNLKLGPVLATLSPFVLVAARARFGRAGLWLAAIGMVAPVLMAGSRAAWLMYALVCLCFAWRETRSLRRFAVASLALAACVALIGAFALQGSERFAARVERSLQAMQGSFGALDDASSGRLRIWRSAWDMGMSRPLTGVGVRGFRHAYAAHAQPGDPFVDAGSGLGAAHAHQIVLEAFSETGLVGVAGWLLAATLLVRAWRRADAHARERAFAPALALLAMCFPLNTHLAFYSAWWGLLYWWLAAFCCAALGSGAWPDGAAAKRAPKRALAVAAHGDESPSH